jgi:hypothetical protein
MTNTADEVVSPSLSDRSLSQVQVLLISRLLRHLWRKERCVILLLCPGNHMTFDLELIIAMRVPKIERDGERLERPMSSSGL